MENFHEEEELAERNDRQLIGRLLGYLRPYARYLILAIALVLLTTVTEIIGLSITMIAVELYLQPDRAAEPSAISRFTGYLIELCQWQPDRSQAIWGFSLLYLAVILLNYLFSSWQIMALNYIGQYVMYDLRQQIFNHLQKLPVQFYDRNPIGRLVTRITADVNALYELMTAGFISLLSDLFIIMGIILSLLLINWRLMLVLLPLSPLMVIMAILFRKYATISLREVRVQLARINAFFQEHISGIAIVQAFNYEARALGKLEQINLRYRLANNRTLVYQTLLYPLINLITAGGIALIVWYGGNQILTGMFTLGALIFFLQSAQRLQEPIQNISENFRLLQAALVASERIFKLLDTPAIAAAAVNRQQLDNLRGTIEFRNVWFAYEAENWILKDLSFRIEAKQSVAFVGHTGAGKTSIINLLLRFYDIQQGQILLDGIDIREIDPAQLRQQFGVVLQDIFLFSRDVATNISLGNESISAAAVRQAAREVHAEEFIERLPDNYQTALIDRGGTLSTGQRQLLTFARALAVNPKILVLDEATSSVDSATEALIRDAITRLTAGRTSLIIAHRLSTIQHVDQIIVLHKGQIEETGTHQQLLLAGGSYHKLYQLQMLNESSDNQLLGSR